MEFVVACLLIFFLSIPFSDLLYFSVNMLLLRLVAALIKQHAWPPGSLFSGDGPGRHRHEAKASGDGDQVPWDACCGKSYLGVTRYEAPSPVVCVFCLSDIEAGEEVRELRCEHLFHRRCLDPWLVLRRPTCPLCRDALLEAEEEEADDAAMDWLAYVPSWAW
ncbi:uncharacterized protein LOC141825696 [Curcuma longa]|uniref:uncharacterized protein LOC141825696 n=1 Tax=Curcuma longa TaxID=136217 RepID=UPI003D9F2CAD